MALNTLDLEAIRVIITTALQPIQTELQAIRELLESDKNTRAPEEIEVPEPQVKRKKNSRLTLDQKHEILRRYPTETAMDIATSMELPVGSVRSTVYWVRKALQAKLKGGVLTDKEREGLEQALACVSDKGKYYTVVKNTIQEDLVGLILNS